MIPGFATRWAGACALATGLAAVVLATGAPAAQYPPGPANCCPDTLTILNIQNPFATPHPSPGDIVLGAGGIITAFDTKPGNFGMYIQMSDGLAYSGLAVYSGKVNLGPGTPADLQLGDSVVVYGKVREVEGSTGIIGTHTGDGEDLLAQPDGSPSTNDVVVRMVSRGHPLPDFHVGTVHDLRESSSNTAAEPWEGTLVRLRGPLLVVNSSHPEDLGSSNSFMVVDPACSGPNCDRVYIDGGSLTTYARPPVGTLLDSLQGIFDQRSHGYRLMLRGESDVIIVPPPHLTDAFPIYENGLPGSQRVDSIMVVFDRPVEVASAENPGLYSLTPSGIVDGARRLDAPDDNRVVLQVHNGVATGSTAILRVTDMTGAASWLAKAGAETRSFVNGVLSLSALQAPDPVALAGNTCEDRSRFAGAGAAAGNRLAFQGTVTGVFGNMCSLQDDSGPRAGLWLQSAVSPLTVGDRYLLAATVQELDGETMASGNTYARDLGPAPVPAPAIEPIRALTDATCDAAQIFLTAEDFEGLLVTLERVGVSDVQPSGASFLVSTPDVFPLEQMRIGAQGGNFTYAATAGQVATITGILRQEAGGFTLYPRSDTDISTFGDNPTFSVPLDASKSATASRDPDIVLGGNGALFMIWARNFEQTVHGLSFDNGQTWTRTRAVPRQGVQPAATLLNQDHLCVLTVAPDSLLFHESVDGGFRMSPIYATVDRAQTQYPALSAGSGNHLHALWERTNQGVFYGRSLDGGLSFTEPIAIALDSLPLGDSNTLPRICASHGDSVYVFWQYHRPGEPEINEVRFRRSLNGGSSFSATRALRDQGNPLTSTVRLAILGDAQVNAHGTIYVLGMEQVGVGAMDRVAVLRSTNGGSTFALVGEPPSPMEYGVVPRSLAVDSEGGLHALLGTGDTALYYTRSLDGGFTWSSAVNITGDSGPIGGPRGAKIILDATGTPVVVWYATVAGSTEIYFARLLN